MTTKPKPRKSAPPRAASAAKIDVDKFKDLADDVPQLIAKVRLLEADRRYRAELMKAASVDGCLSNTVMCLHDAEMGGLLKKLGSIAPR